MELIFELVEFLLKAIIVLFVIMGIVAIIASSTQKKSSDDDFKFITVSDLNAQNEENASILQAALGSKKDKKAANKQQKKEKKQKNKDKADMPTVYVLEFDSDIKASGVENLRHEITAVLNTADTKTDKVLVKITSSGGMVHAYGLAAAQLTRLKDKGLELITSIDTVAASGGYMMACTGQKILCAPFAIVGSIGVVASVPNVHRLLKKHDIDYEEITAGEYKRTVSTMGEITEKGKEKFSEQIQSTHDLFKRFVRENRPSLDVDKVSTGEYWFGWEAIDKGLVDEITTSDAYLLAFKDTVRLLHISTQEDKKLGEKLAKRISLSVGETIAHTVRETLAKLNDTHTQLR